MENLKQIEADIRRAEEHLRGLKDKKDIATQEERKRRQEPYRNLAEKAHDLLCPYNHTDGCGWGYEKDSWGGHAHRRWLDSIEALLSGEETFRPVKEEELDKLLDHVAQMKQIHENAMYILSRLQRN